MEYIPSVVNKAASIAKNKSAPRAGAAPVLGMKGGYNPAATGKAYHVKGAGSMQYCVGNQSRMAGKMK